MVKYQSQTFKNWLQSNKVCEQKHMLRMMPTPRNPLLLWGIMTIKSTCVTNGMAWHLARQQVVAQ